jgi:Transposase DDE domain group 1
MPAIHKGSPKIKFQFVASKRQSVLGGLPAIEAMAQEFGLWSRLRRLSLIDPRKRKGSGFGPDAIVAQFIYCFAAGGASLADAERLEEDSLARRLARMDSFADETTLGEWLRAQTPESVRAFWELIREFIAWAAQRAQAGRWKYGGRAEVFFDDTQLELSGRKFEGAKINYNGDLALSWQTFWFGPWLADGQLGSPGDVSDALPAMLEGNQSLWAQGESDFLADSGSSAAKYLQTISAAGFTNWSVSYNKWTSALERTAAAQPESAWSAPVTSVWRDGSPITEQHCLIRHTPEQSEQTFEFAAVRFLKEGEMFWNYRFLACEGARRDAAAIFARHKLKGEKEQLLKEVLRGLDLHHPPCAELQANAMFYAIAALAYNLLVTVKLLCLPEECQSWQVKTMLRQIIRLPATLVRHARRLLVRVEVPARWLVWWENWQQRWWSADQAAAGTT